MVVRAEIKALVRGCLRVISHMFLSAAKSNLILMRALPDRGVRLEMFAPNCSAEMRLFSIGMYDTGAIHLYV